MASEVSPSAPKRATSPSESPAKRNKADPDTTPASAEQFRGPAVRGYTLEELYPAQLFSALWKSTKTPATAAPQAVYSVMEERYSLINSSWVIEKHRILGTYSTLHAANSGAMVAFPENDWASVMKMVSRDKCSSCQGWIRQSPVPRLVWGNSQWDIRRTGCLILDFIHEVSLGKKPVDGLITTGENKWSKVRVYVTKQDVRD